jgi:hypothetical protein
MTYHFKDQKDLIVEKLMTYNQIIKEINFIKKTIASYYNLSEELCFGSKKRNRDIITVRHLCIYFSRKRQDLTCVELGKVFECNHATVLHAIGKINDLLSYDKRLKKEVEEINQLLNEEGTKIETNLSKFIDLNDFTLIEKERNKYIILSGFSKDEIHDMFKDEQLTSEYSNTGIYIKQ